MNERRTRIATVDDLRRAMRHEGLCPSAVGYCNDPELRTDEGNLVLRKLRDGTWETAIFGRGQESHHRHFPDEAHAVDDLACTYLPSTRHLRVDSHPVPIPEPAKKQWWRRSTTRRHRR